MVSDFNQNMFEIEAYMYVTTIHVIHFRE